jgi:hypothetical protein
LPVFYSLFTPQGFPSQIAYIAGEGPERFSQV